MNWPAFTNPWLLAGLAAVALPLVIHWLTRARPRRIAFPPYKFLVEACAGRQAVDRLRALILLTIRCLLVAALALLFARPFLKPSGASAAAKGTEHVVIVLDASLSMRAVQTGVSLFSRAQGEAAEVLRGLPSGAEAAVILEGASPRSLLPALSANLPALHDELVKTTPTYEKGDPAAALALAHKLLAGPGTIYVFSDFQKSNWEEVRQLPDGITCRLRAVCNLPVDNVAITSARVAPAAPVIGESAEVICTVFNCTPGPREETVRLELGEFVRETRVTVAPFGTANAVFNVDFSHEGIHAGKVSLSPDDLMEDNHRFVSAEVGKALQLALVSDADTADWRSGAFYLARALVPSPEAAPGLKLVRRRGQDLDRGLLETADVFVLASPVTLSGEASEIIARRVSEGARLLVFLDGPNCDALMFPSLLPPFQLLGPQESNEGDSLNATPRKLFADLDASDFSAIKFRRHLQNRVLDQRQDDVLFAYPDGSAALAIHGAGKGSVVWANLPLAPDAGDFAGNPVFPAMTHELLRALRQNAAPEEVAPGAAWVLNVPTPGEGAVTMVDPSGKNVPVQMLASGRTTRLSAAAAQPGVYDIKQGNQVVARSVVNVDSSESDTRPIALENLKVGANAAATVLRGDQDLAVADTTRELWPKLAGAAAALLALEMLLLALWRSARLPAKVMGAKP